MGRRGDPEVQVVSEVVRQFAVVAEPAQFGTSFVKSAAFKELFREGMGLIEDTAAYLDGDGRTESNHAGRHGTLTYAGESMRLTTRLMQVASWLLVQRAVAEGELTRDQAQREKDRVRLVPQEVGARPELFEALPERLRELISASLRLHARVMHLDRLLMEEAEEMDPLPANSPVALQHALLRTAFAAN